MGAGGGLQGGGAWSGGGPRLLGTYLLLSCCNFVRCETTIFVVVELCAKQPFERKLLRLGANVDLGFAFICDLAVVCPGK